MVLMVLEVVLVVLEVVLVVLEVTGPQVPWGIFQIRLSLRPDLYFPAPPIIRSEDGDGGLGGECGGGGARLGGPPPLVYIHTL